MQTKSFKRKIQLALLGISALASIFVFSCKTEEDSDKLTGVSITCDSTAIGANGQLTLTADVSYNGSPSLTYDWSLSETSYASLSGTTDYSTVLSAENTITEEQSVTVTLKVSDGTNSKTAEKTITVYPEGAVLPTGITLTESTAALEITDDEDSPAVTLTATLTPEDVTSGYDTVTWTSSDKSVATVSDGVVTAVAAGSATITAATVNGYTASCEVTVTSSVVTPDFSVVPGAGVTTFGWADVGSMAYPDTTNIIYIADDGYKVGSGSLTSYTTSQTKRVTFTNAIASGSVSSSKVGTTDAIIILSGTVDLSDGAISDSDHTYYDSFDSTSHARTHGDITYEIGSNKTIIGVNTAKVAFGGLIIKAESISKPGSNIIIRNITFWDAHGSTEYDTSYESSSKASADNLALEGKQNSAKTGYDYIPTNIWIDHCVFTDGTCSDLERNYNHDGSLDMKAGKNVTVSYCEFTNHDKVTLLAPNDYITDPEERQITFHHNYYHGAVQRMPRSRGCQLHIYNNYYNDIGTSGNNGYALGPGIGSQYIVEGNYFGSFQNKIVQYADSSTSTSATTLSKFYQKNNSKTLTSSDVKFDSAEAIKNWSEHETSTAPWTITYDYTADSCSDLPTTIPNKAGADKSGYSKVISVNGTVYGE